MKHLNSLLALLGVVALSACSAVKNMDEMKDTTKDMKNITQDMSTTTNGMAETTERMDATSLGIQLTSDDLYEDLRQGNAMTFRSQRLEAMDKNNDQLGKVSEAAKYFMSFEYQLFKNHVTDTPEKLEYLKFNAVQEFLREIAKYATGAYGFDGHDKVNMFSLNPLSRNNNANLNALVVAMHLTNPNMDKNSKLRNFPKISMMDLIEEALLHSKAIESGKEKAESLSPFINEVLDYEPIVYWLIQVRHNFLATMAVAKFSHLLEKGPLAQAAWVTLTPQITTDLHEFNTVELKSVILWLTEANRNVEFLRKCGLPIVRDEKLTKILKELKIKRPVGNALEGASRTTVISSLVNELNRYKN